MWRIQLPVSDPNADILKSVLILVARRQVRFPADLQAGVQTSAQDSISPRRMPNTTLAKPRHPHKTSRRFRCTTIRILLSIIISVLAVVANYRANTARRLATYSIAYVDLLWTRMSRPVSPVQLSPELVEAIEDMIRDATLSSMTPRDHALAGDGAGIVPILTSGSTECPSTLRHPADVLIRPNLDGGGCWTVANVQGQVAIALHDHIFPSHFTIDHVPVALAADPNQAPREVRVWGALDGRVNKERYQTYLASNDDRPSPPYPTIVHDYTFVHLADLEYDIRSKRHIQTFPIGEHIAQARLSFGVYVFQVLSNWGGDTTCIYRIRIHGRPRYE